MNQKTITSPEKCTGCAACANACPVQAITMEEDVIGHLFPSIDSEKCINCALCEKICPGNRKNAMGNEPMITYAAWAKDNKEHESSTSGGVAAVLARAIVEGGGVAYGCTCNPGGIISHERIALVDDLWKLKGSKYVQSEIGLAYQQAKADLEQGICVLFTGTPCQIAGLKSFLRRDYDNLYTADLVCHGVPPQRLLFEHLGTLGIKRRDVDAVRFREQTGYYLSVISNGELAYRKSDLEDAYYSAFNDCLFTRQSCVACQFAQNRRVGDITLADFHRLGTDEPFDVQHEGLVSLVLVNSEHGKKMMEESSDKLYLVERSFLEAERGNPQLKHPATRKSDYNRFVEIYQKKGFSVAIQRTQILRRIKNRILLYLSK